MRNPICQIAIKAFVCVFAMLIFNSKCAQGQLYSLPHMMPSASFDSFMVTPGIYISQITDSLQHLLDPADTGEGGGKDQLEFYRKFWQKRVVSNDSSGRNMFQQYHYALREAILAGMRSACGSSGFQGDWAPLGPDNMAIQAEGKVDVIWADTGSSKYLLAGTGGGLFKSVDDGAHWSCITDNAPLAGGIWGVTSIAVNSMNKNTIYISTSSNATPFPGGAGILKSFDGGATWQQEFIDATGTFADSIEDIGGIFITPDSTRLYALAGHNVYTRLTSATSWTDITPTGDGSHSTWYDLKFKPGYAHSQDTVFISNSLGTDTSYQGIYEATDPIAAGGWDRVTLGFLDTLGSHWSLMTMSMPNKDNLYFIARSTHGYVSLARYNMADQHIHLINENIPSGCSATYGGFSFVASNAGSNNANRMIYYYGVCTPFVSFDGGQSVTEIGEYDPFDAGGTHADIRSIYIKKATNSLRGDSDIVYFATDGGVSKKVAGVDDSVSGVLSTIDISGKGLVCGTFWSFTPSEYGDLGIGGMLHDGLTSYQNDQSPKWQHLSSSDAWYTVVDKYSPKLGYGWFDWETFSSAGQSGLRLMADITSYTYPPIDPIISTNYAVGPPTESDNTGNLYYADNELFERAHGSTVFLSTTSSFGFPDNSDPLAPSEIALVPNASSFTGYILYLKIPDFAPNIYYRNPTIPRFLLAQRTSDVPSVDAWSSLHYVNCITTDATNPENVWVGQNGINLHNYSTTRFKVQYSPDHGTHWIDISNGLPQRIPVTKIIYDETTGYLYCSTDAGIYKYNFNNFNLSDTYSNIDGTEGNNSVVWTCFNNRIDSGNYFPNAMVTDLRINHCEGKLYAATYGRGIWSTDINAPGVIVNSTDTIKTNTNWIGGNHYISGGITIPSGITLTISSNDTVHMPKGGVIAVLPGGQLIVDHSEITNDCDQCMWQGIQARGQVSLPQYPSSNQGWVIIRDSSTIQHAVTGVSNSDQGVVWSSDGGIVQCSNSNFINNHEAVSLLTYDNIYADHSLHPNLSYFSNCTFLLDNNYKGNVTNLPMQYMAYLGYVEGVRFAGCQFINRDTFAINRGIGEGIRAVNSGFTVGGYCASMLGCSLSSTVHSRFCGFTNGIDIQNAISPGLTVSIDYTNFDSVSVGEVVTGFSNVSTTRSNFIVGHGYSTIDVHSPIFTGCYQNIGILNQNSALFRMEGNTFIGKPNHSASYWYNYGTVVANTGYDHINDVYRNTFGDSLTMSIFSLGCNKSFSGTTGLIATCNNFSNNANDVYVASDGSTAYMQGMAIAQGSSSVPAGNNFYGSTHNIVNNGWPIDYFYDVYSSATQEPYDYSSGTASVGLYGSLAANSCPSSFAIGTTTTTSTTVGVDHPILAAHKSAFQSNKTRFIDSTAAYNSRIDFGNTDSLLTIIGSSSDTVSLYSILSSGAPYISETALQTVGDLMKMPYHSMMNLLQQNPDNLTDNNFVTHMKLDYSLSSPDLTILATAAQVTSARTTLQNVITSSQINMANEGNIIMMALKSPIDTNVSVSDTTGAGICTDSTNVFYMTDSNSYYVDLDSVDTWLQNIGGLWTQYDRMGYYNFKGQYSIADSIFTSMASTITIPSIDWDTHNSYSQVWGAIHSAELAGRTAYQLTPTEIAGIDTFSAPLVTYNSGVQAAWSLTTGVITTTTTVPIIPLCITGLVLTSGHRSAAPGAINGGSTIAPIVDINSNGGSNAQFSVYPNPTTGMVTFFYNVPNGGITITITNVVGEKISELQSTNNSGNLYWNPGQNQPGVYLYQAQNNNGNISKGKLILAR
jgi:hypothetical protein